MAKRAQHGRLQSFLCRLPELAVTSPPRLISGGHPVSPRRDLEQILILQQTTPGSQASGDTSAPASHLSPRDKTTGVCTQCHPTAPCTHPCPAKLACQPTTPTPGRANWGQTGSKPLPVPPSSTRPHPSPQHRPQPGGIAASPGTPPAARWVPRGLSSLRWG